MLNVLSLLASMIRRVSMLALLACVLFAALSCRAHAAGTVSGDDDISIPFVIQPAGDPADSGNIVNVFVGTTAFFVQNMPRTRTVEYVTLGNLNSRSECGGQNVTLYVFEAGTRQWGDWRTVATATARINTTSQRVTWQISPTTMQAGKGYAFHLFSGAYSPCSVLEGRSWDHGAAQVNAGPDSCSVYTRNPHSGDPYRYWHVQGQNDVDATCANGYDEQPQLFQSSMPTGWLSVIQPFSAPFVAYADAQRQWCPAGDYGDRGVQTAWPGGPAGTSVCTMPQFAPPGVSVPRGWYYALVQDSRYNFGYRIRDLYLRLADVPPHGDGTDPGVPELPPDASNSAGGSNPGAPNLEQGHCACGDPIDAASGNLYENETDLAVAGRGLPLEQRRSYNSMYAADSGDLSGRLGFGWSGSWSTRLDVPSSPGPAFVHNDNGSTVPFTLTENGNFVPAPFVSATLKSVSGGGYVYTLRDGTSYFFDGAGILQTVTERNGYVTTLSYGSAGRLAEVTNADGASLSFRYDQTGRLGRVTASTGQTIDYAYDAAGNLVSATNVAGETTRYEYDALHRLTGLVDANGHRTSTTYDGLGRADTQTNPEGETIRFAYSTNETILTDARGTKTKLRFNRGQLTERTDALGTAEERLSTYGYDDDRNLVRTTDALGHTNRTRYDDQGHATQHIDELGRTTKATYTATGFPKTVTDPSGVTTTYAYDSHDNLTSVSQPVSIFPDTAVTRFTYDPEHPGDITSKVSPAGNTITYTHDNAGRLTSVTDAEGNKTTYAYAADGSLRASVAPKGNASGADPAAYTTTFTRDPLGRITEVKQPTGATASYEYDDVGNAIAATDERGHTTAYTYDRVNRVTSVIRPDGSHIDQRYDDNGNVVAIIDGLEHTTTYAFDSLNRLIRTTDPLGRATRHEYDAVDRKVLMHDANGKDTTYTWDAAGQLSRMAFSSPGMPARTFDYDANGRRTKAAIVGGSEMTWTYDSLGRVFSARAPGGVITNTKDGAITNGSREISYRYDLDNNVTRIFYPQKLLAGPRTVVRRYDRAGRMVGLDDFAGRPFTFSYDANGNMTRQEAPNGVVTSWSFDRNDRATRTTATGPSGTLLDLTFDRDDAGLVANTTPVGSTSQVREAFTYDSLNRLETATIPSGVPSVGVPRSTFEYDDGDRLIDANRTGIGNLGFAYDDANELTKITGGTTGQTVATLSYDDNGQRTGLLDAAGNEATYTYNQLGELTGYRSRTSAAVANVAGLTGSLIPPGSADQAYSYNADGLRADLLWHGAEGLPVVIEDATFMYITGPDGLPLEQVDQATNVSRFYNHDAIGSTRLLTDFNGRALVYSDYDPYGQPLKAVDAALNPFGFAGQYTDARNGLIYMRARWYDPKTAQFLTRDPLGFGGGSQNLYQNVGGTPTTYVDPAGLCNSARLRLIRDSREQAYAAAFAPSLIALRMPPTMIGALTAIALIDIAIVTELNILLSEDDDPLEREGSQDKKLTPRDIQRLKDAGHDPHDVKSGTGSDLYKDRAGNIYEKPIGGKGPGEPLGINLNRLY